MSEKVVSYY